MNEQAQTRETNPRDLQGDCGHPQGAVSHHSTSWPLNPAGTPCSHALRLSCHLNRRFVCCFSVHLILSSPFPKGSSHGCYSWHWPVIHPVEMGSLRKTFHTVLLPCYNNSQFLIFLMPLLLKSSELWCLEAEEGNDQSIEQAPVSHLGCRGTSEHLGDWKSCSVSVQANLNVALISNL